MHPPPTQVAALLNSKKAKLRELRDQLQEAQVRWLNRSSCSPLALPLPLTMLLLPAAPPQLCTHPACSLTAWHCVWRNPLTQEEIERLKAGGAVPMDADEEGEQGAGAAQQQQQQQQQRGGRAAAAGQRRSGKATQVVDDSEEEDSEEEEGGSGYESPLRGE